MIKSDIETGDEFVTIKKRIGILTFHRTINYGGVLQAYALKKVIERLGCECNIIDYKNQYIEKINEVKLIKFNGVKEFLNGMLSFKSKKNKLEKFIEFRQVFLKPTGCINEYISDEYDSFIVGSDQVWNYLLSDFDRTYFLDFVKGSRKKNAYSASFGISNIPEEIKAEYSNLLSTFNRISIRENSGLEIIKDLIDAEVSVVLDPTLLISQTEWKQFFKISKKIYKEYIILYLMIPEPNILRFTEELSRLTGCEIIYITSKVKKTINARYAREVSPTEWVELIMNAKYVVTNSFHGVAFSINFNKEFFMGLLPEPSEVNSRLENVLRLFNLEKRKINNYSKPIDFHSINYETVNNILRKERDESIRFLNSIIEETYE